MQTLLKNELFIICWFQWARFLFNHLSNVGVEGIVQGDKQGDCLHPNKKYYTVIIQSFDLVVITRPCLLNTQYCDIAELSAVHLLLLKYYFMFLLMALWQHFCIMPLMTDTGCPFNALTDCPSWLTSSLSSLPRCHLSSQNLRIVTRLFI